MEKKGIKWEKISNPLTGLEINNYVLRGNGFYVSYNPDTQRSIMGKTLDGILNFFHSIQGLKEGGGEETALVKGNNFYILKGDFRKEYERLVSKGFKACYKFYLKKKKKFWSPFSTDKWNYTQRKKNL